MKRFISALPALALTLALLAGCAGGAPAQEALEAPEAPAAPSGEGALGLELLTPIGQIYGDMASDESAVYMAGNGKEYFYKFSFAGKKLTLLDGRPESDFREGDVGGLAQLNLTRMPLFVAYRGALYCFAFSSNGALNETENQDVSNSDGAVGANAEGSRCAIVCIAADGSSQKTYDMPEGYKVDQMSTVACDKNGSLYFVAYSANGARNKLSLCSFNTESGEITELSGWERDGAKIVGAFGGSLVLLRGAPYYIPDEDKQDFSGDTEARYSLYSPATGAETDIEWQSGLERGATFYARGRLVTTDYYAKAAEIFDLASGETTALELPKEFWVDSGYGKTVLGEWWFLPRVTDSGAVTIAVNLEDGSCKKLATPAYGGGTSPIRPLAESAGYYFLWAGFEPQTQLVHEPGGGDYLIDGAVDRFLLISKTDFWSEQPNYIQFEGGEITGPLSGGK